MPAMTGVEFLEQSIELYRAHTPTAPPSATQTMSIAAIVRASRNAASTVDCSCAGTKGAAWREDGHSGPGRGLVYGQTS
jgi:hypothetical protein